MIDLKDEEEGKELDNYGEMYTASKVKGKQLESNMAKFKEKINELRMETREKKKEAEKSKKKSKFDILMDELKIFIKSKKNEEGTLQDGKPKVLSGLAKIQQEEQKKKQEEKEMQRKLNEIITKKVQK